MSDDVERGRNIIINVGPSAGRCMPNLHRQYLCHEKIRQVGFTEPKSATDPRFTCNTIQITAVDPNTPHQQRL